MSVIARLWELQELESEISAAEKGLAAARGQLGESPALKQARGNHFLAQLRQKQIAELQKDLEWKAEDLKAKLDKVNEQLYSGRIRNPKELTSLQHEAETFAVTNAGIEEQALGALEQLEEAGQQASAATEAMKQAEAVWQNEQTILKQNIVMLEEKINILTQQREAVAAELDSGALQVYQRIKTQRGTAVARVEQGTCGGCHMTLSTAQLQHSRGANIEKCANCSRILYSG